MVTILMMSAKMATLGLHKIKVFWNKGYHIMIFIHNVTNKIQSHNSIYVVDDKSLVTLATVWDKLLKPQFYEDLIRKNASWGLVLVQVY